MWEKLQCVFVWSIAPRKSTWTKIQNVTVCFWNTEAQKINRSITQSRYKVMLDSSNWIMTCSVYTCYNETWCWNLKRSKQTFCMYTQTFAKGSAVTAGKQENAWNIIIIFHQLLHICRLTAPHILKPTYTQPQAQENVDSWISHLKRIVQTQTKTVEPCTLN